MPALEKVVVVTRRTALDDLVRRFNTRDQARFYITQMGGSFESYEAAHDAEMKARQQLRAAIPRALRSQWIDREFLPNFQFGPDDLVITVGPDGLVVNTAKYLDQQRLLALNPDQSRIDGVLVPFPAESAAWAIQSYQADRLLLRRIVMARADLNDGQSIHAVNDLFVGAKTHVSARYRIALGERAEDQSSSGLIISTGAGSTGWHRSILTGAAGVVQAYSPSEQVSQVRDQFAFGWEETRLMLSVREPFLSRTSQATILHETVTVSQPLEITSHMPQNGVIFSDGVEEDFLEFNSGAVARIMPSDRRLHLLDWFGRKR
jgi:NAD kinase